MIRIITLLYFIATSFTAFCETADFSYSSGNGVYCAPSTVQFTQTSSGTPVGFAWDFGNGNTSNIAAPSTSFTTAGSYVVKLLVIYPQTTIEISKTIIINPSINVSIGFTRNYICIPGPMSFTANSNGNIASYEWSFGDNTGTFVNTTNAITHAYTDYGVYTVRVKAIDISGCFAESLIDVAVLRPRMNFPSVNPTKGCIPANVNLYVSVFVPTGGSVTSYVWDFGDGSPVATSATGSINHTYTAVGSYTPTLNVTTNEGCTNTLNFTPVAFGTPPVNHIAYPKQIIICGSDSARLVSIATNANTYHWDFGDGRDTTVTDTIVAHKYATLGIKTVTAIPYFNGCPGTPISFTVTVTGVIAGYSYLNSCSNPKQYSFTNTSQGNLSTVNWDFGDGSPVINTVNAVHTFPPSGTFDTKLTVTDNITGCVDTFTRIIYTADPSLVNPDAAICRNSRTTFSILNNYNNPDATYTWNVAGLSSGPNAAPVLSLDATIHGNFTNNYVIINNGAESCPDTVFMTAPLLVKGPDLNFTGPASICFGSPYNVVNSSQAFVPTETVVTWFWNFGNAANDTIYQPVPYTAFPNAATWMIKLTAIDINGCRDTLQKPLIVNPKPFLASIPRSDTLCLGLTDTLIAFHTDNITWSPANLLSCATCDTVLASPISNTQFYVTALNSFGCSAKDSVNIKVIQPFTATTNAPDIFTCMNTPVQLTVEPPLKQVVWTPSTGLSNANIYNPVASPPQSTTYTATLTDSIGCFSSAVNINVNIKSLPVVDAGPDKFYPYNEVFSFTPTYSSNIISYLWSPATLLTCSDCAVPNGIATYSQLYTLTATSDSGCIGKDNVNIFVECKYANLLLPTAFTPNNDGRNDYFYPITRGIKMISHFIIYNRQGQIVFEANNFLPNSSSLGWDGNFKGNPESTGAFVYVLEAVCEAGETLHKKGNVILIR